MLIETTELGREASHVPPETRRVRHAMVRDGTTVVAVVVVVGPRRFQLPHFVDQVCERAQNLLVFLKTKHRLVGATGGEVILTKLQEFSGACQTLNDTGKEKQKHRKLQRHIVGKPRGGGLTGSQRQ